MFFKPKKYLGQNFLKKTKSQEIIKEIIKAANLQKQDTILEIGPGFGILTKKLAQKAKKVIAVEKDERLTCHLKEVFKNISNLQIVSGDVLKFKLKNHNLKSKNYKIVGNIPYSITSPLIRKFLSAKIKPKLMILMVQKEVGERILGKNKESFLSNFVKFYGKPEILKNVSRETFWPKPKVDGAILKIDDIQKKYKNIDEKKFFEFLHLGFSQPRKQIKNNLNKIFQEKTDKVLKKCKIDPQKRPEDLKLDDWIKIFNKNAQENAKKDAKKNAIESLGY